MKKYISIGKKVSKLLMISGDIAKENLLCVVPSEDVVYNSCQTKCLSNIHCIKEYECKGGNLEIKLTPLLDVKDLLFLKQFLARAKGVTIVVQIDDNETSFLQAVLLAEFALNLGIRTRIIVCTTTTSYGAETEYIEFFGKFIHHLSSKIEYYQVALNQWADDTEDDFIVDTSGELFDYI